MKKIRILAILLAMLMLPLSLFVACDKNKGDEPDPDIGENPGDNGENPGGNEDTPVYDNDGTKSGYLMFFNFDAASTGDLNVNTKPYSDFLFLNDDSEGVLYIIDKMQAKENQSLLIKRKDAESSAKVEVSVKGILETLSYAHTLEFDLRVSAGCITDDVYIVGTKNINSKNTFLKITAEGMYDAAGELIYEIDPEDKWINVALGIDDSARKYTLYIDGEAVCEGISYVATAYKSWSDFKPDSYSIETSTANTELYLYIDNLGVLNGTKPMCYGANKDTSSIDIYEHTMTLFNPNDGDAKAEYVSFIKKTIKKSTKTTPYPEQGSRKYATVFGEAASTYTYDKLSLGELYAMYRYNKTTEKFTQISYEYGYELGDYSEYGAVFGNKAFKADDNNWFYFKANGELEFVGMVGGNAVSGNYEIAGTEDAPAAVLKWGENSRYVTYNAETSAISVAATAEEAGETFALEAASELPFSGKTYGYTLADTRLTLTVYDYLKKADLVIEGVGAVSVINSDYTYAEGVLTIGEYTFTYDSEADTFTYGENTFGKYDPWALIENEVYCVRYANFLDSDIEIRYSISGFNKTWEPSNWNAFKVSLYVPEGMADYGYGMEFGCGSSSLLYFFKDTLEEGWNEIVIPFSSLISEDGGDIDKFRGNVIVLVDGYTDTGAVSEEKYTGVAENGKAIVIEAIELYQMREVAVNPPAEGKEDCTHVGVDGESLLVPVEDPILGDCNRDTYYVLECSECKATKLDTSREFKVSVGHIADKTEHTQPASCIKDGYTYKPCTVCGERLDKKPIEKLEHNYSDSYDSTTNMVKSICKNCGYTVEKVYIDSIISGVEKYEYLGLDPKQYGAGLAIAEGINDTVYTSKSQPTSLTGNPVTFSVITQGARLNTRQLPNGMYVFEHVGSADITNGYFELNTKGNFKGKDFVYDTSVMLGQKNEEGNYMTSSTIFIARALDGSSIAGTSSLYSLTKDGYLVVNASSELTTGQQLKFKLSEKELTYFSFAAHPSTNTMDVYVNGYYQGTTKWLQSTNDGMNFNLYQIRNTLSQSKAHEDSTIIYGDSLMVYLAKEPICVLSATGGFVKESTGDIVLGGLDDSGNVRVTGSDVKLEMPQYTVSSKYVIDFTLEGTFGDGVLLKGIKEDKYKFQNEMDLITISGDYVYYLGTPICTTSDLNAGAKITLEVNDKTGKTNVYINGTIVPGGPIEFTEGDYGDAESLLLAYVFCGEVSATYRVKNVTMYTGALKTEE